MTGADDQPVVVRQTIGQVALVVRDYDEAIHFYVDVLGFVLIKEQTGDSRGRQTLGRRWPPPGSTGSRLLFARAVDDVGRACSDWRSDRRPRISVPPRTDDFWRDFHAYNARASSLSGSQRWKATARLPSLGISTATSGIYFNLTPGAQT